MKRMIKRLFVICAILCVTQVVMAEDVTKIDASKVKQITFNGDLVMVKYNDGTPEATLDMATLVIDFSGTTNIEQRTTIVKKAGLQGKKVYDLKGREVLNGSWLMTKGELKPGVYIIDNKKIIVK